MDNLTPDKGRRAFIAAALIGAGLASTSAKAGECSGARFETYKDAAGEWRWRLWVNNGNQIANPGEGYTTYKECIENIESLKSTVDLAPIVRKEEC